MKTLKVYLHVRQDLRRVRMAFTLLELLIVIGVISLLISILLPSLSRAKELAKQTTCLTRVAGQVRAIHMYAADESDLIPFGENEAPFYGFGPPRNTVASNQLWIGGNPGSYEAHGVLLKKRFVQPTIMFCPDDDSSDPVEELPKIYNASEKDAYCSYLYRQLDGQREGTTPSANIASLGFNNQGDRVNALVMDVNSLLPEAPVRTNHRGRKVSVGFLSGNANIIDTPHGELTITGSFQNLFSTLDRILEYADKLGQ